MLLNCCCGLSRQNRAVAQALKLLPVKAPQPPQYRLRNCLSCSVVLGASPVVSAESLPPVIMTEPLAAASRADEGEYSLQLAHKVARIKELFNSFKLPALEVFESERSHYRMRYACSKSIWASSYACRWLFIHHVPQGCMRQGRVSSMAQT